MHLIHFKYICQHFECSQQLSIDSFAVYLARQAPTSIDRLFPNLSRMFETAQKSWLLMRQ